VNFTSGVYSSKTLLSTY